MAPKPMVATMAMPALINPTVRKSFFTIAFYVYSRVGLVWGLGNKMSNMPFRLQCEMGATPIIAI